MKVFLKKIVLISAAFIFLSLTACAKPSKKTSESKPVNPEILKLNKVLLQMSDRCKQAIPNGDPEEFLADLHRVLDTEKDFSSEDLSPFFLIDKTHKVSSSYEPKNLIHLEKMIILQSIKII